MSSDDIVVGLDFDISSRTAYHWAAEEARASGRRLVAVHVLSNDSGRREESHGDVLLLPPDEVEHGYRHSLLSEFDSIRPEPNWRVQFARGSAGKVLVETSRGAHMLVVGTREHVGLSRLLDGSVSHYCLSHAGCPVVAVPSTLS
jgi:nucleotide-binding universal stress UspA family protein